MYKSISKYLFALITLCALGCKEPCLDIELIEEKTEEMQSWYTNTDVTSKIATSNIGITDEIDLTHNFQNFGDTIWDDCGNASKSERSTVRYEFFNFPFSIETEFNKQGEENGFKFIMRYNTYSASYKFTSGASSSNNTIEYVTDYEFNTVIYQEAFKINFNQTEDDDEIKEVIFVKGLGIIHIELNSDAIIELNE